ncbi:PTS sugar transporter subunit IIA [Cetobacterium somerae]|uniref:PTS sugar transporter subunit IIA n=1 Tax=Cetobacterium sp. NK01 TaxID=2993530 RepID=UPI002115E8F8|nr:PTS sugar transporter subunit IIA [Cetobacterium sp. NK01]MCQ8212129.1 PTS sugar transporter subunit IIA [Cetobacterium sp. NK01]
MIYKIGNFFSKLILKNIYLFIALGIIRWSLYYFPNLELYGTYFEIYLLPMALAYSAGNILEKNGGGIVAIISMSISIFLYPDSTINQGIVVGVTSGFLIKYLNIFIKKYVYSGFQMFLFNFLYPLIALITGEAFYFILKHANYYLETISKFLIGVVQNIYGLIILTPILEIGKVFFFNNIINHGILSILGFNDLSEKGKSLLFLLETNPGPGLGVLLGLLLIRSRTSQRVNLLSNIFVQVIGGIHEVYFPYILKNLKLLWAVSLGGLVGNLIFYIFKTGLIGVASPGSILNLILLSKDRDYIYILLGFGVSTGVSFFITYIILKKPKVETTSLKVKKEVDDIPVPNVQNIKKIVFLCDAGMGSSAIGANMLKTIFEKTKFKDIDITNSYIGDSLSEVDLIITHEKLKNRVIQEYPNIPKLYLEDFLDKEFYIDRFLKNECLEMRLKLSLKSTSKSEALKALGEDLENFGFVMSGYKDSLVEREITCSTYIGNGIAIPHGSHSSLNLICKNGVVIHHYPYGVDFENGEKVYILIGITIKNQNLRLDYIANIINSIEDEELIENLILSDCEEDFIKAFNGGIYVK